MDEYELGFLLANKIGRLQNYNKKYSLLATHSSDWGRMYGVNQEQIINVIDTMIHKMVIAKYRYNGRFILACRHSYRLDFLIERKSIHIGNVICELVFRNIFDNSVANFNVIIAISDIVEALKVRYPQQYEVAEFDIELGELVYFNGNGSTDIEL